MDLSNANANAINPRRGLDLPLSVLSPLAYLPYGCQELPFRLASHSPHSSRLNRVCKGFVRVAVVANWFRMFFGKRKQRKANRKVRRKTLLWPGGREMRRNPWRTGRLNECGEEDTAPMPSRLSSRFAEQGGWGPMEVERCRAGGQSHTEKKSRYPELARAKGDFGTGHQNVARLRRKNWPAWYHHHHHHHHHSFS